MGAEYDAPKWLIRQLSSSAFACCVYTAAGRQQQVATAYPGFFLLRFFAEQQQSTMTMFVQRRRLAGVTLFVTKMPIETLSFFFPSPLLLLCFWKKIVNTKLLLFDCRVGLNLAVPSRLLDRLFFAYLPNSMFNGLISPMDSRLFDYLIPFWFSLSTLFFLFRFVFLAFIYLLF